MDSEQMKKKKPEKPNPVTYRVEEIEGKTDTYNLIPMTPKPTIAK